MTAAPDRDDRAIAKAVRDLWLIGAAVRGLGAGTARTLLDRLLDLL
jgi:hypothetical protein